MPEPSMKTVMPESLKKVIEKLPTAEALKIVDDLGFLALGDNNNQNNNNKPGGLDDALLNKITKLPSQKIKEILDLE